MLDVGCSGLRPPAFDYCHLAWLAAGMLVVVSIIYLLLARAGALPQLLPLAVGAVLIYRKIRNQPVQAR
jgi:hypothetical protein